MLDRICEVIVSLPSWSVNTGVTFAEMEMSVSSLPLAAGAELKSIGSITAWTVTKTTSVSSPICSDTSIGILPETCSGGT